MKQLFPPEIIQNSAENYFIQQHTASRAMYLILIVILIIFIVLLPVIKIDITVHGNGVIRSRFDDNLLQSAVSGEVIKADISENISVKQGDTLIVISTLKTDSEINYCQLQAKEETINLSDLSILLKNDNSQLTSGLYRQESVGFLGILEEQKVKMTKVNEEFILAEKLYEKKVIPKTEYEFKKYSRESEISRFNNLCEQQKLTWQTRYSELRIKIEGLKSNIEQLERGKRQYIITAPISGTITSFTGIKVGNFVVPNQQIARISPDYELLVECYISPTNIGLIHQDMEVRFQFHSFNYNQWGTGSGKVTELSDNVININDKPYFKVRCSLDQSFLALKNGYKGHLRKGMTLTGGFMITRRSLSELLYDKTDNWLNPKIYPYEH